MHRPPSRRDDCPPYPSQRPGYFQRDIHPLPYGERQPRSGEYRRLDAAPYRSIPATVSERLGPVRPLAPPPRSAHPEARPRLPEGESKLRPFLHGEKSESFAWFPGPKGAHPDAGYIAVLSKVAQMALGDWRSTGGQAKYADANGQELDRLSDVLQYLWRYIVHTYAPPPPPPTAAGALPLH